MEYMLNNEVGIDQLFSSVVDVMWLQVASTQSLVRGHANPGLSHSEAAVNDDRK